MSGGRARVQVCLTRSCFLSILHWRDSSLVLKEKTLNPEIAALGFEPSSAETAAFTGWDVTPSSVFPLPNQVERKHQKQCMWPKNRNRASFSSYRCDSSS